ncbi:S8 family serine peptidase [bacterium]|nr:S8 family serine peptidase [bacterium]
MPRLSRIGLPALMFSLFTLWLHPADTIAAPASDVYVEPGIAMVHFADTPAFSVTRNSDGEPRTGVPAWDEVLRWSRATEFNARFAPRMPNIFQLRFDPMLPVEEVLDRLETLPGVVLAEPNLHVPVLELGLLPDDPRLPDQWHHPAIASARGWALSQSDEPVKIGILDTGLDYTHSDLEPAMAINEAEDLDGDGIFTELDIDGLDNDDNGYVDDVLGYDWVDVGPGETHPGEDHSDPDPDPMDFQGHGTHCAGCAAAETNNGIGVAAPGWGCTLVALRCGYAIPSGNGLIDMNAATDGVMYAIDNGIDVISMSFGGSGTTSFFATALGQADEAGIVLLAAAGNDGTTNPHYPAALNTVIGVAASAPNGNLAHWSTRGDWVSITSPGQSILATIMGDSYAAWSGTSMATPVAAGVAGRLKALRPMWTGTQIGSQLTLTADDMIEPGTGSGHLNFGRAVEVFVAVDSVYTVGEDGSPWLRFDESGTLGLRYGKSPFTGLNLDVELTLEANDPRVTLETTTFELGDVIESMYDVVETEITVENGDDEVETFWVDATFNGLDNYSHPYTHTLSIPVIVGTGEVLLLDYEWTQESVSPWINGSLTEIGAAVRPASRATMGDLFGALDEFPVVIAATGNRETDIFSVEDLQAFALYMDNGGKLMITGQNAAESLLLTHPAALDTLFDIALVDGDANTVACTGVDSSSLGNGINFLLRGAGGADNQEDMDVLQALNDAEMVFEFPPVGQARAAGVHSVRDNREWVFLGFGLEGVGNAGTGGTVPREVFLHRLLMRWGVQVDVEEGDANAESLPRQFDIVSLYPNPTNGALSATVTLPRAAEINLAIYDLLGRKMTGRTLQGQTGQQVISFALPAYLASGTYFLRVEGMGELQTRRFLLIK